MAGGELDGVVAEVKPRRSAFSIVATILKIVACVIPVIPLSLLVLLALSDSTKQQQRPLVYGALLAFLSQLSSIGKGLQKVGVKSLRLVSRSGHLLANQNLDGLFERLVSCTAS